MSKQNYSPNREMWGALTWVQQAGALAIGAFIVWAFLFFLFNLPLS